MKIKRSNGETFRADSEHSIIKSMFLRQWANGNIEKYMQNVKQRVKEAFGIELEFSNQDEFFDALQRNELISIINK